MEGFPQQIGSKSNHPSEAQFNQNEKSSQQTQHCCYTQQTKLQFYEKNIGGDLKILAQTTKKLILDDSNGVIWSAQYSQTITVNTIDFDGQSVELLLHYGNYKMKISAIITQLDDIILNSQIYDNGSFGTIYKVSDSQEKIVLKGINYVTTQGNLSSLKVYKQYFMAKISSCIKTGPKLLTYLGYDLIFFKRKAFFAMQQCSEAFAEMSEIQKDLVENLRIMHSIGFMHLDIKPDNIAYSQKFKKFVFLDFGFSKLILESLGKKTFSLFYGTLSYCSEQMKNVYYAGFPSYVDLYFNDLISLSKSFEKKKKYFSIKKKLMEQIKLQESREIGRSKNSLFSSAFLLLRLKYYIWVSNVQKVLSLVRSEGYLEWAFWQILFSQNTPKKVIQNFQVRQLASQHRRNIVKNRPKIGKDDKYFIEIFKSKPGLSFSPISLSIEHILSLPSQKFAYFFDNGEWAQKLFCVLNPFSNYFAGNKGQQYLHQVYKIRMRVIDKIFAHGLSSNKFRSSNIRLYKSWNSMKSIYQKLKPLHNRDSLITLRLIFLLLGDYQLIQQISNSIIDLTDDQNLKLLTIIQYQLFFDIGLKYLEPVNKDFISFTFNSKQNESQLTKKIRNLAIEILSRERRYFEVYCKPRIIPMMRDIQKSNCYEHILRNIKFLYGYLARQRIQIPIQENGVDIQANNKSLEQMVYSVYFQTFTSKNHSRGQFYYFCKTYQPMMIFEDEFRDEETLRVYLEEIFQIKKEMNKPWVNFINFHCEEIIIRKPSLFWLIVNLCRQLHSQVERTQINKFYMLRNIFYFLDMFFRFTNTTAYLRNIKQSIQIINLIEDLYRDMEINESTQEDQWVKAYSKCFEGIFFIIKRPEERSFEEVEQRAKQILALGNRIKQMDKVIVYCFLGFFLIFELLIKNQQSEHFMEKYILQISDSFADQVYNIPFRINRKFLSLVICINSKRDLHARNIELLQRLFQKGRLNHDYEYYGMHRWKFISYSMETLCRCTPSYILKQFFKRLNAKSINELIVEEIYTEFHLLTFFLYNQLCKYVLGQVLRLFNCLGRIVRSESEELKSGIYKVWRKFSESLSKRKKLICLRRQKNYEYLNHKLGAKAEKLREAVKKRLKEKLLKCEKC